MGKHVADALQVAGVALVVVAVFLFNVTIGLLVLGAILATVGYLSERN